MSRQVHTEERVIFYYKLQNSDVFCWNIQEAECHRREQLYIGLRKTVIEVCKKYFGQTWSAHYVCASVLLQEVVNERFFMLNIEILDKHRVICAGKLFYTAADVRLDLLKYTK